MAATAEGVPTRCLTFPGRSSDHAVIRRLQDDLGSWRRNRVIWRSLTRPSPPTRTAPTCKQERPGRPLRTAPCRECPTRRPPFLAPSSTAPSPGTRRCKKGGSAIALVPNTLATASTPRQRRESLPRRAVLARDVCSRRREHDGGTWRNLGHELDRMHLVTLEPSEARLVKPSTATKPQREILAAGGSRTLPEPRP